MYGTKLKEMREKKGWTRLKLSLELYKQFGVEIDMRQIARHELEGVKPGKKLQELYSLILNYENKNKNNI